MKRPPHNPAAAQRFGIICNSDDEKRVPSPWHLHSTRPCHPRIAAGSRGDTRAGAGDHAQGASHSGDCAGPDRQRTLRSGDACCVAGAGGRAARGRAQEVPAGQRRRGETAGAGSRAARLGNELVGRATDRQAAPHGRGGFLTDARRAQPRVSARRSGRATHRLRRAVRHVGAGPDGAWVVACLARAGAGGVATKAVDTMCGAAIAIDTAAASRGEFFAAGLEDGVAGDPDTVGVAVILAVRAALHGVEASVDTTSAGGHRQGRASPRAVTGRRRRHQAVGARLIPTARGGVGELAALGPGQSRVVPLAKAVEAASGGRGAHPRRIAGAGRDGRAGPGGEVWQAAGLADAVAGGVAADPP